MEAFNSNHMHKILSVVLVLFTSKVLFAGSNYPGFSPITNPVMACEKITVDHDSGERKVKGAYVFYQKDKQIKIWQTGTGNDQEGLLLETIAVKTYECPGCYDVEAEFVIHKDKLNYFFQIRGMNVEHLGAHLKPQVQITMNLLDSDHGPLIMNDLVCWNFK